MLTEMRVYITLFFSFYCQARGLFASIIKHISSFIVLIELQMEIMVFEVGVASCSFNEGLACCFVFISAYRLI